MSKKVLVTGGAGFIGSHLVERLVAEGYEVVVIDNCSTGNKNNLANVLDKINFYKTDLLDFNELQVIVNGMDVVYHLAAKPSVPFSLEYPMESRDNNIGITVNVLEASKRAGVKRLIFASSSSIYGDQSVEYKREDLPFNPLSPYAVYKAAGEMLCKVYGQSLGLETVIVRFFNVFGPRQNPNSQYAAAIPLFITKIKNNDTITIYGDGEQRRDFTYVDNVVDGLVLAGTSEGVVPGDAYNIACGDSVSVNDAVKTISEYLNAAAKIEYMTARSGEVLISKADISKIVNKLGYCPKVRFKEGVKKLITWYESRY